MSADLTRRVARSLTLAVEARGLPARLSLAELTELWDAPPTKMLRRVGQLHATELNALTQRASVPFCVEYEAGSWARQVKTHFRVTSLDGQEVRP